MESVRYASVRRAELSSLSAEEEDEEGSASSVG
jgi:hypothetical protein